MKTLPLSFTFTLLTLSLAPPCLSFAATPIPEAASVPTAAPSADFGDKVQLRGNLNNCRIQFEQHKKGRVAFIGGSITEMDGYRPMVCEWLKKKFPETEFTFIAAGISSTCSTTGAFRVERDVLSQGPVDLFFVEFAVNDDQDAHHARTECIRGMEGILRHARQNNPNMDLVVTYFVNEGMLQTLQEGKTPLTMEAHEAVAKHYDVSTIHLAKEVADEITAGTLTWKAYGGVHPAPFGNAIGARMIEQLFHRAWAAHLQANAEIRPHPLPEPMDVLSYSRGRFLDLALARVKKGWTLGVPDWKSLEGGKRARFTTLPMLSAQEAGAELTVDFEGDAIGAFIVAGPDAGIAEVSVDGGAFRQVDLYHAYSTGLHYPRTVMLATDLKPGNHTLTLRMAKETKSKGTAMRIMEFAVSAGHGARHE